MNKNVGYHYGDLGKAEFKHNFIGGTRSTGAWGTGTYFVSEPTKDEPYASRPMHIVDFNYYINLFVPANDKQALELHRALLDINNYDGPAYSRSVDDIWNEWDRVVEYTYYQSPDNIEGLQRYLKKYGITYNAEDFDDLVDMARKCRDLLTEESKAYRNLLDNLYFALGARFSKNALKRLINDSLEDLSDESRSSYIMKNLGFSGIDVRHLPHFDNFSIGSVLYNFDPKSEITNSLTEAKEDRQKFLNWVGNQKYLDLFDANKQRMEPEKRDIYWWMKNSDPDTFKDYLNELSTTKTKSQKEAEAKKGAVCTYNKNGWKVYRIDTYEAATYYGKGTKWCICGNYEGYTDLGQKYFNQYKNKLQCDYYFIISPTDIKWCYLATPRDDYAGVELLWDASDTGMRLDRGELDYRIPQHVLKVLPYFYDKYVDISQMDFEHYIWDGTYIKSNITDNIVNLIVKDGVEVIPTSIFNMAGSLESVTLPNSVVKIERNAFRGCNSLQRINLPEGLKIIDHYAFHGTDLQSVELPESLTYLGEGVFYMSELRSIKWPKSISEVPKYTFEKCSNLTNVELPEGVTNIGMEAFYLSGLRAIKLPSTLKSIGPHAFNSCKWLQEVNLPQGLKYLGNCAFYECQSLTTVRIPGTVSYIDSSCFESCTELVNLTIDEGVESIYSLAFNFCRSLKRVSLPDSIEEIGQRAFKDCDGLEEITLGKKLFRISTGTFKDCNNLKVINYRGSKDMWDSYVWNSDPEHTKQAVVNCLGAVTESLMTEANSDKQKLINHVGEKTAERFFDERKTLKPPYNDLYYWLKKDPADLDLYLANYKSNSALRSEEKSGAKLLYEDNTWSIRRIDSYEAATYYGRGTKWCITGNYAGAEDKGKYYFDEYLDNGVDAYYFVFKKEDDQILKFCYLDTMDDSMNERIWDETDHIVDVDVFANNVPKEVLNKLPHWSLLDGKLAAVNNFTYLDENSKLPDTILKYVKKITVGENVTILKDSIFYTCVQLKEVNIESKNLEVIGPWAFGRCLALERIDLPDTVIAIGSCAFNNTGLKEFNVPKRVSRIHDRTFASCNKLEYINLNNVSIIGDNAFACCTKLKSIDLSNVTGIDSYAFYGCHSLHEIYISNKTKFIYSGAFDNCKNLKTIYCEAEFKPAGWDNDWYDDYDTKVVWGYKKPMSKIIDERLETIKRNKLEESK